MRSWGGAGVGGKTGAAAGRWWDVDLWLVRKLSGQPESSAHSRLRVTDGAAFAFVPVSLDSPQGPVVVQVTGSFRVQDAAGGPQLLFTTNRRVTVTSAQMPRDRAAGSTGTSTNTLAMPGPDDVVAFELPAVQLPNGGGTIPDQFSVRVRIAPGSTPQPDA